MIFLNADIMTYLHSDLIEDFIFGDIGAWGGVWHNWNTFGPNYMILAFGWSIQYSLSGGKLRYDDP